MPDGWSPPDTSGDAFWQAVDGVAPERPGGQIDASRIDDAGHADDATNADDTGSADDAGAADDAGSDALVTIAPALLTQERWVNNQNGFWDAQKWLAGDFDGDGRTDLANVFDDRGQASINVYLSTGSTFVVQRWATQQNGFWDAQKWLVGDFDGDRRADLANVFDDQGEISINVHLSTGSAFVVQRWATQQNGFWDAQKWLAGDFDGDGRTDLANVFDDFGQASIDVHRSTGWIFTSARWVTRQVGFWDTQKWLAADFDGDGVVDLADVFNDLGLDSIDVHRSTGWTFTSERWVSQQGGFWDAQKWLAGDFDGDRRADLANVFGGQFGASIDVRRRTQP